MIRDIFAIVMRIYNLIYICVCVRDTIFNSGTFHHWAQSLKHMGWLGWPGRNLEALPWYYDASRWIPPEPHEGHEQRWALSPGAQSFRPMGRGGADLMGFTCGFSHIFTMSVAKADLKWQEMGRKSNMSSMKFVETELLAVFLSSKNRGLEASWGFRY